MARRCTTLLICLLLVTVAGTGIASATTMRAVPHASTDGIDPAERDAVNGQLGYHEKRNYPYGLLVFLVVMTPVALIAIRRWTPEMEDGPA
jgi:hypothetical protein